MLTADKVPTAMKINSDTSPEAERAHIASYRALSFAQKWRQMGELYRTAKLLHAAGVRRTNPQISDAELRAAWRLHVLGPELAEAVKEAANRIPAALEGNP